MTRIKNEHVKEKQSQLKRYTDFNNTLSLPKILLLYICFTKIISSFINKFGLKLCKLKHLVHGIPVEWLYIAPCIVLGYLTKVLFTINFSFCKAVSSEWIYWLRPPTYFELFKLTANQRSQIQTLRHSGIYLKCTFQEIKCNTTCIILRSTPFWTKGVSSLHVSCCKINKLLTLQV